MQKKSKHESGICQSREIKYARRQRKAIGDLQSGPATRVKAHTAYLIPINNVQTHIRQGRVGDLFAIENAEEDQTNLTVLRFIEATFEVFGRRWDPGRTPGAAQLTVP
jgi:hypothetical protein